MPTIYLSSTYEDLKDYRQVVFESLRKAGHQVIAMEDYVATDRRPLEQCLKDVEQSDMYVGLFAFRYGYVPPENHGNAKQVSITELEFRHAETHRKPCLTFVVNDTTPWPRTFDDAHTAEDKGQRINTLRQYLLTEKLASPFSSPHELSTLVLAAVAKHLEEGKQSDPSPPRKAAKSSTVTWDIEQDGSPYPGLFHFTRRYAPVFFGRDADVREILDRLREPEGRFMIVSGDSGVGKSSVVDAGLLPKLENGGLPDSAPCLTVRMVPSQRQQPLEALLGALGDLVTKAGLRPDALLEDLTRAPDKLGMQIKAIMKKSGASCMLVLFIDQMEEFFTAQDPQQAKILLSGLYHAAQEQALWVIGTIRSDHLQHCYRHSDMVTVLRGRGHYPLGHIEPYMMQDMIVKPAHAAGLSITETFAKRLIHDTQAESGNLPLLAFALEQLFQHRTDHELSEGIYNKLGGIAGAIAVHVETVEGEIQRTFGQQSEDVFPTIFHMLVKLHKEKGIPTRNRPLRTIFTGVTGQVVDLLITKRLLRSEGTEEEATVSISHETLFEAWPALKDYVAHHEKSLMDRTLLESRAQKWQKMGQPWLSGLATGREYHDFQQAGQSSTALTKQFLQASRRARRGWMGAGLMVLLLLGGITWLWQKGYNMDQAFLKIQSLAVSIHLAPQEKDLAIIPGGRFQQGDVEGLGEGWRNPGHEVAIPSFMMGKYEVTFEEYDRFAIATNRKLPDDQGWGRGQRPVINVSWENAKAYAAWLAEETGEPYRLPTESEWEYAARSGEKQEPWAGPSDESQLGDYAVYAANSGNRTAVIGSKQSNSFGLYDMSGNVWEWVEDCWHWGYERAPRDGSAWLEGDGVDCKKRVIRGGSWDGGPDLLRSSVRGGDTIDFRTNDLGFRLVQGTP